MAHQPNNVISEKILTAVFTVQHREQCGSLFNIYFTFDGRYIILFGVSSKLIFNNLPHDRSTHLCLSVATKRVSRQSACSSLPFLILKRSLDLASRSFRVPSQETGSFRSSRVFFGPQSCESPHEWSWSDPVLADGRCQACWEPAPRRCAPLCRG